MPCTIPPPSAPQEALCTGKGAAARRERAVEAGWLELLISACSAAIEGGEGDEGGGGGGGGQGEGEDGGGVEGGVERTPAVGMARAALRSITRDSMQLQHAALDAGALRQSSGCCRNAFRLDTSSTHTPALQNANAPWPRAGP